MSYLNIYLLGVRSGSITDKIYKVRDELLNRAIGELSSAVLRVKLRY